MITKYMTRVFVKFSPFGKEAKTARLIMASVPPKQRILGTKMVQELITDPNQDPMVKVTFKDKKEMEYNLRETNFEELSNLFDTHSRKLKIVETIQNQ
ncbi:large ribosomal subunit protein mL53, partial [Monosporozyma unispora]|nr:39S ribosomal protein L44, mitochondrial [Kazachstania unispora]